MNKILLPIAVCILLLNCSNARKENTNPGKEQSQTTVVKQEETETVLPSNAGIVKLDLVNGKGSLQIQKNENETVYIQFTSEGYKKISAHLSSPDSTANVRFSQIIMPDGKMDGPFGGEMEYDLPMDGIYKLSVHENMMAGDPWSGIFKAEITLSK